MTPGPSSFAAAFLETGLPNIGGGREKRVQRKRAEEPRVWLQLVLVAVAKIGVPPPAGVGYWPAASYRCAFPSVCGRTGEGPWAHDAWDYGGKNTAI